MLGRLGIPPPSSPWRWGLEASPVCQGSRSSGTPSDSAPRSSMTSYWKPHAKPSLDPIRFGVPGTTPSLDVNCYMYTVCLFVVFIIVFLSAVRAQVYVCAIPLYGILTNLDHPPLIELYTCMFVNPMKSLHTREREGGRERERERETIRSSNPSDVLQTRTREVDQLHKSCRP